MLPRIVKSTESNLTNGTFADRAGFHFCQCVVKPSSSDVSRSNRVVHFAMQLPHFLFNTSSWFWLSWLNVIGCLLSLGPSSNVTLITNFRLQTHIGSDGVWPVADFCQLFKFLRRCRRCKAHNTSLALILLYVLITIEKMIECEKLKLKRLCLLDKNAGGNSCSGPLC